MNKCRTDSAAYHDPDDVMTDAEEREQEQKQAEARIENYEKFGSFVNHDTTGEADKIIREIIENDDDLMDRFVLMVKSVIITDSGFSTSGHSTDALINRAGFNFANNMLDSGQELPWRNE